MPASLHTGSRRRPNFARPQQRASELRPNGKAHAHRRHPSGRDAGGGAQRQPSRRIRFRIVDQEAGKRQYLSRQGHARRAVAAGGLCRLRRQSPRLPGLQRDPSRLLPDPGRRPRAGRWRSGAPKTPSSERLRRRCRRGRRRSLGDGATGAGSGPATPRQRADGTSPAESEDETGPLPNAAERSEAALGRAAVGRCRAGPSSRRQPSGVPSADVPAADAFPSTGAVWSCPIRSSDERPADRRRRRCAAVSGRDRSAASDEASSTPVEAPASARIGDGDGDAEIIETLGGDEFEEAEASALANLPRTTRSRR